jgi:Ca2+-binding RTX toxin-like protein
MATITIGKSAGNFNFEVLNINFKTLLSSEGYKSFKLVSSHGTETATLTQKDGDYTQLTGDFNFSGLLNHNRTKAVNELDGMAVGTNGKVHYTIEDLGLTSADLKTDKTLAKWADAQSYTIVGNDYKNELAGGGLADKLYGNGGNDALYGGAGNDKLYGGDGNDVLDGGNGKNVLVGGDGDDTYHINANDTVTEAKGKSGGEDAVIASTTNVDLDKFDNVENAGLEGKGDYKLLGNDLVNTLTGNDGDNFIDGGKGADRLIGGKGDDTYVVDNAKDVVVETGKNDHDTINATVSVDLSKLRTVEDVFLFGKADIDATGNAADNTLTGNDGANTLWGAAGDDTLTGGKGVDTFEFHKGDKFDTITDFDAKGSDHDQLALQGFGKNVKFSSLTIDKVGKSDVEISFGHGDTLHIHLDHSSIKDIDASDFQF